MPLTGVVAVGVGAALGAWLRWWLGIMLNPVFPTVPLGTLAANLIGAYLVGLALEVVAQHAGLAPEIRLFFITGFLGALTTYSTFSAEAVTLLGRQQLGWAAVHIGGHLFGSLAMTVLGMLTIRALRG